MSILADPGLGDWGPFANLAATAVVSLLLVWLVIKYLPKKDEEHRQSFERMSDKFDLHLKEQRKSFLEDLGEQRSEFITELRTIRQGVADDSKLRDDALRAVANAAKEGLTKSLDAITQLKEEMTRRQSNG